MLSEFGSEAVDAGQVSQLHVAQDTRLGILTLMRLGQTLFILFVVTPIAEIALFLTIGERIGIVATLVIVVATAIVGASLVSRQGRAEFAALQSTVMRGAMPAKELAHGAMILVAGALLLTPGFLTDGVGFALLVPPIREVLRRWFSRRYGTGAVVIHEHTID